jgi:uncharacterized protein YjbI with pentapeptide repeats
MAMLAALLLLIGLSAGMAEERVVPAEEVLDKIEAGQPVEYDGCTIVGDLDLDMLEDLPSANAGLFYQEPHVNHSAKKKSIASPIRITNSTIKGRVNLNNTEFSRLVDFRSSKFQGHAGFRGAIFKEGADLSHTQFCLYADFLGSEFGKSAYFDKTRFTDYADFEGAYFDDYAKFGSYFITLTLTNWGIH